MTEPVNAPATTSVGGLRLTPRESGAWEIALGLTLEQFPQSYLGALIRWKREKDAGHPITIDEALDSDWSTISEDVLALADPTQSGDPTNSSRPNTTT